MKTKFFLATALIAAVLTGHGQGNQDWAKSRLEKSSRHQEWVEVKNGARPVNCFVVYPEVKNPAPAVIVIHEIFGLTPWARSAADEVAAEGVIAIAPDLLSGAGPNGGGSSSFASTDDAIAAIQKLPPAQITGDLNAVADYAKTLSSCNGTLGVAGFCWGGGQTFRFACHRPELKSAFVFYGPPPATVVLLKIKCPVYGFYAENDSRISSTIPATKENMKAAGKIYDPVIYPGAGHGFMRAGEQPDAKSGNKKARDAAWKRFRALLRKL